MRTQRTCYKVEKRDRQSLIWRDGLLQLRLLLGDGGRDQRQQLREILDRHTMVLVEPTTVLDAQFFEQIVAHMTLFPLRMLSDPQSLGLFLFPPRPFQSQITLC